MKTIVIGSGLAGLTAGAYLARAGHEVIILEQNDRAGGVAAEANRDGYRWDSGQLNLEAFSPGEPVGRILADLDIAGECDPVREERGVVYLDFRILAPERFGGAWWRERLLKELFPEESAGIARYYRLYRRMAGVMAHARRLERATGLRALWIKLRLFARLLPALPRKDHSAARVAADFFRSEKLRAVFLSMLADFAVRPDRFPGLGLPAINPEAAYDRRMPIDDLSGPSYVCLRGGMQTLVDALVRTFERAGGRIEFGVAVDELEIEDGRVTGLRTADGTLYAADCVIASGGARELFAKTMATRPGLLPDDVRRQLDQLTLMQSVFMVHLGVNMDPRPHQPQVTRYYINTYDIEGGVAEVDAGRYHEGRDGLVIHIPTLLTPGMAPPGKHAVTIYTIAPDRLGQGDWEAEREHFADRLVAAAEQFVPGLKAATETRLIVTPADFRKRTHLRHHAFGGIAPTLGHPGFAHETPLENLWFVGAQSESGGGVNNVMLGAWRTARRILDARPQRKGRRARLLLLGLFLLAGVWFAGSRVACEPYNLKPGAGPALDGAGRFAYAVPLDPTSPWPRFRANSLQNGRSPVAPRTSERKPWSFRTGKGIFSSAVVDAEGTVYIGSADHNFYAIDRDGRLKWKFATGEIIDSAALLDDRGRVYFGSGDAYVYALDRADGRLVWKSERAHTVAEVEAEYDMQTYNVDWFEGNVGMLADGTIVAPNDNYLIYGFDRDTGARKRIYVGNELMWSLPAFNARTGRIFSGSQFIAFKNVFAWDANTGEEIWSSGGLGSNAGSPLLTSDDPRGALVVGGYDGIVRAYAQANGEELWSFGTRDHIYASPAQQADGTLIQASADGTVYALDPEDGALLWAYDTLEPIRSSPAIDGRGIVYVGSGEGKLFAINPDGSLRWAYQCITEVRNDLNGSPGLGADGVYVAGESGEVFFVPYDYPLTAAGRADPKSVQGPGEILPDSGVFLIWTEAFGGLTPEAPATIAANQPLTFTLFVREAGDTVLSAFDPEELEVSFELARTNGNAPTGARSEPLGAPRVALAANKRFVTLVPDETWTDPAGGQLIVRIKGRTIVDQARFGLKFFGGRAGALFERSFRFVVPPRTERALPYLIPRESGAPATALELSRLAAPNPTMLPSWNQIGFDSLHYLAGFVEGDEGRAVLWVVPGKLDERTGRTVVAPELKDRFVLNLDYDGGLLTFYNYDTFLLTFVGSWDMPFAGYRVSARSDPRGRVIGPATLNALVLGDELEFYGKFLKIMGLTDLWTGHMEVFGGMNLGFWNDGTVTAPAGTGAGRFSLNAEEARVDIEHGSLRADEHVFGLLLVDAASGRPLPAHYARGLRVEADEAGRVTAVVLPLKKPVRGTARAYYMVDTYPALRAELRGE